MDTNANSLRRAFRVPTPEQVKKTAKRLFKRSDFRQWVPDKRVLTELRTYKYKSQLAKELQRENEKPSPD